MELEAVAGILADFGEKVTRHTATMTRMIEDFREQQTEAIMLDKSNTGTISATGLVIIDLDGPPASYYWVVREIIVSDQTLWTNSMGAAQAQWGKGSIPPQATAVQVAMPPVTIRWVMPSCPNVADFGTNHFNLKHGDRLYCQVTGGTSGQVVQATAAVEQWSIFSRTEYGAGPEAHS